MSNTSILQTKQTSKTWILLKKRNTKPLDCHVCQSHFLPNNQEIEFTECTIWIGMGVEGEEENEIFPCWYFLDLTLAWRRKCETPLLFSPIWEKQFPSQTDRYISRDRKTFSLFSRVKQERQLNSTRQPHFPTFSTCWGYPYFPLPHFLL